MEFPKRIIKRGETNKTLVKAIQNQLNAIGCGPVTVDGIFENETFSAIKLFQARNTDSAGNALKIDGILGAISWGALFKNSSSGVIINAPNPLLASALKIALTQVGQMENPVGSNWGQPVKEYLNSVGLNSPNSWCMAFVYWCFNKAALELGRSNPLVKTGGVLKGWNDTTALKIVTKDAISNPTLVLPGQIFILSTGGGFGHTGIVESVSAGILTTIEGNSNEGGSREGTGVFRRTSRKIKDINKGFIQYS